MQEMTIKNLKQAFKEAKEANAQYIGVSIQLPECGEPEIIINPQPNFDEKLKYYERVYDEQLRLHVVPAIRIVGWHYADTFAEIQGALTV